jgi:DNA-binding transcriptional MerR regulator
VIVLGRTGGRATRGWSALVAEGVEELLSAGGKRAYNSILAAIMVLLQCASPANSGSEMLTFQWGEGANWKCATAQMTNPKYITITAFAQLCDVSAKTLRFYSDIGLFRPAFIDPRTRYRFYLQAQLRDFAHIQAMRVCGASLVETRRALNGRPSAAEQRRFLQRLRNAKLDAIDEARRSLAWIEGALQDLEVGCPLHVTIKYCAPVKVVSVRSDIKQYTDVHQHEKLLWQVVAPEGRVHGVLWHSCADGGPLECEPFVEAKNEIVCPAAYQLKELSGAHVARAFSSFDDYEAEAAYVGLSRWIRAQGYRLAGARRKIYRGQLLEIQYLLQAE